MPLSKHFIAIAAAALDDDRPHAVALDPIQKRREARACLDGVRTGDGCIIELCHDLKSAPSREGLDRLTLAFLTVLVGADVGRR